MSCNKKETPQRVGRGGILIALAVLLLAGCGGGGGGGETASNPSSSAAPSVTDTVVGTTPDGTTPAGLGWTTRLYGRDVPQKMIWNGMAYVGVGGEDGFQISEDSKVWSLTSFWSEAADIAWDGSIYVAPGSGLSKGIYTSSDGKTWTRGRIPDAVKSVAFFSAVKSNALWVAVGENGTIIYSTDAADWTATPAVTVNGTTPTLRAVTWTGSQFIAVGDAVVATSPNGLNWTVQQSPTTNRFFAIASHGGLTVAATDGWPDPAAAALMTSTDGGVNWTKAKPLGSYVADIVHAGGKWVVASTYNSMTSTDGTNWTEGPRVDGDLSSVVHNGKEYVATGTDGTGVGAVFASNDGLNWHTRNVIAKTTAAAVSPDGRMVAVGVASDSSRTSMDGVDWEFGRLESRDGINTFWDITWSPKLASFVGLVRIAANQDIYTSTDGKNWQALGAAPCGSGATVIASPEILVNAGNPFLPCLATSVDGVSWQRQVVPWTTGAPTKGYWTGSQFIVVGTKGLIFTSPDGATWTPRTSNTTDTLYGAAASPSKIVVVGYAGTILTSADNGVTWTPQASGTTLTLNRAVWTRSEFYAVGIGATVLKSTDGVTWSKVTTPFSGWSTFQSPPSLGDVVVSSSGRVVVFGSDGLVATVP